MTNISHASLTGSQLHEPKGADSAVLGTVYVSNGAGSGSWQSVGTSAFTGMIADFAAPVAPAGWLELDGSTISTSTYAGLFAVMSITSSGTRTNGSPTVTSVPSTSNFAVGYYVFGTGITAGTTIISIDSASQITLSNNATSSGSASFFVCPWAMNTGTVTLPDLKTAGRYRRSRTSSTIIGSVQASQNISHNHTGTITSSTVNLDHGHTFSGSGSASVTFGGLQVPAGTSVGTQFNNDVTGNNTPISGPSWSALTGATGTASVSGTTNAMNSNATHAHTTTIPSDGGTEARPVTMVVLTCVKT